MLAQMLLCDHARYTLINNMWNIVSTSARMLVHQNASSSTIGHVKALLSSNLDSPCNLQLIQFAAHSVKSISDISSPAVHDHQVNVAGWQVQTYNTSCACLLQPVASKACRAPTSAVHR